MYPSGMTSPQFAIYLADLRYIAKNLNFGLKPAADMVQVWQVLHPLLRGFFGRWIVGVGGPVGVIFFHNPARARVDGTSFKWFHRDALFNRTNDHAQIATHTFLVHHFKVPHPVPGCHDRLVGAGTTIGNVKDGIMRAGPSLGAGSKKGNVPDYTINGIERERDDELVAVYHFLIKKFL
jgi:hypothetical protein